MVQFDTPERVGGRSQQRQCWLAMQAAYGKYRQASALVHGLADDLSNGAPSLDNAVQLQTATRDRQIAFEDYIEARLRFLEFSCDQDHFTARPGRLKHSRIIYVAGAITIGLSALNTLCLSWVHRQVDEFNSTRREMNASVNELRRSIAVVSKPVASNPSTFPTLGSTAPQVPQSFQFKRPAEGSPRPVAHLVRTGRNDYGEFSIAISPRFTRIGSIRISAPSVDRSANQVNLCVASGTATFCKNGLNPYQWLPIQLGDPRRSAEVLVTRIGPSRVQGYCRVSGRWPPPNATPLQIHWRGRRLAPPVSRN